MEDQKWCMCDIGLVYRDGFSTCAKCGGKDAYKKNPNRPNGTVEQKYIYWHPGDEQPEDLSGWMVFDFTALEKYRKRNDPDGSKLCTSQHYRKAATNTEHRAHHGMKLWHGYYPDSKIQDGHKVIDYRRPDLGELFATHYGSAGTSDGTMISFAPILEKIEPEIQWVTPTQADVIDCIKATRDYPEVVFEMDLDDLSGGSPRIGKLVYVGDYFVDSDCDCFSLCKMNAALREEWK